MALVDELEVVDIEGGSRAVFVVVRGEEAVAVAEIGQAVEVEPVAQLGLALAQRLGIPRGLHRAAHQDEDQYDQAREDVQSRREDIAVLFPIGLAAVHDRRVWGQVVLGDAIAVHQVAVEDVVRLGLVDERDVRRRGAVDDLDRHERRLAGMLVEVEEAAAEDAVAHAARRGTEDGLVGVG